MRMNLYLAQILIEEHGKDALPKEDQARLVKIAQNTKRIQLFQFSALQHLRIWWNGGNNLTRSMLDNLRRGEINKNVWRISPPPSRIAE